MSIKTYMEIRRITDDGPTFGVFKNFEGKPFAVTLEPAWLNNLVDNSCIPSGDYLCKRVDSPKYGDTFEITGVPGRTHVLFHWGNLEKNTKGCVLVAEKFGILGSDTAILQSRNSSGGGFNEFLDIVKDRDDFWIRISY